MAQPEHDFLPAELDELLSAILPEIPGYRVVRLLGRGGMSYVYLGIQDTLERQVAIKVMSPLALEDEISRLRFEKEARTIAKLQHPGIVGIHAVGRLDLGLSYYVMPYLSRGHLGERDLRRDEVRIMGVLRSLLGALDYAHMQGVVHRDVKAENVLFDHDDRPLLTDFGIAITKRDHSRMTGHGNAVGSWGYMAPEQARGEQVDGRADIYSLGVLTHEMLTGRLPFHDEDTMALALMHALEPIPRLPEHQAHWQALIDQSMAKTPEARFATARDMLSALDRIALAPRPVAAPATRHRQAPDEGDGSGAQLSRRIIRWAHPHHLAATALLLVAVLLAAVFLRPGANDRDKRAVPDAAGVDASSVPAPVAAPPVKEPVDVASAGHSLQPVGMDEPAATGMRDELEQLAQEDGELEELAGAEEVFDIPSLLPPGDALLLTAGEQIRRRRLTQPRGSSAYDNLLEARKILGQDVRLKSMGERWLAAVQPYLVGAVERGDIAAASSLLGSIDTLGRSLVLLDGEAWKELQDGVDTALRAQLQRALAAHDLPALRAARARADQLGIASARLEPEYSSRIILAKVGDSLRAGGTSQVLLRLPSETGPGLAMSATVVTRRDYAEFARATGRAAEPCRNRAATVSLKKRSWQEPGFAQSDDHPVVCVTAADAQAYATWRGASDGVTYRLPSSAEWRTATGAPATVACGVEVQCQARGTAAAQSGARRANGIVGSLGNIREWLSSCSGCTDHAAVGVGWRDTSSARKVDEAGAQRAYDDVGFRLVRDVAREVIEQY